MPLIGFVGTPAKIDQIYRDQVIREQNESPAERASRIRGLQAEKARFYRLSHPNSTFEEALEIIQANWKD